MVSSSDNSILSEIRQQRIETEEKSSECVCVFVWATLETRKLLLHITFLNTPHFTLLCYKCENKKHFFCHPPPIILTSTWRSQNTNSFMESNIIALFYLSTSHTKELNINTFTRFSMNEKLSCLCVVYTETCEDGGKCDHVMFVRHSVGGRHWGW